MKNEEQQTEAAQDQREMPRVQTVLEYGKERHGGDAGRWLAVAVASSAGMIAPGILAAIFSPRRASPATPLDGEAAAYVPIILAIVFGILLGATIVLWFFAWAVGRVFRLTPRRWSWVVMFFVGAVLACGYDYIARIPAVDEYLDSATVGWWLYVFGAFVAVPLLAILMLSRRKRN